MKKFYGKDYFDSELSIFLDKHARINDCAPHIHDFLEIVYVYDGKGAHTVDGVTHKVEKGTIIVINSGQVHSFVCHSDMMQINILFDPGFFGGSLKADSTFSDVIKHFGFECDEEVRSFYQLSLGDIISAERICDSMKDEAKKRSFAYKEILSSYIKVLVGLILRSEAVEAKENRLPKEILEYIDLHCFGRITIEDIAKNSFYNPAYLGRIFKECYGKSIKEYISEKRISRAIGLLLETSMTVENIAAQVGYSNKNQFYKHFENITGKSPAKIRKNIK